MFSFFWFGFYFYFFNCFNIFTYHLIFIYLSVCFVVKILGGSGKNNHACRSVRLQARYGELDNNTKSNDNNNNDNNNKVQLVLV